MPGKQGLSLAERFNQYVYPDPNSGCWIWGGSASPQGYGELRQGGRSGRNIRATHIALELAARPRPEGAQVVRHKCDFPPCVNPDHLEWGTFSDNTGDAIKRGRLDLSGLNKGNPGLRRNKLTCGKGHSFSEFGRIKKNGARECKECHRLAEASRRKRAV